MEKATLSALENSINTRAEIRLKKDLAILSNVIQQSTLFGSLSQGLPGFPLIKFPETEGGPDKDYVPFFLFRFEKSQFGDYNSSLYMDKVKKAMLPIYIQHETKMFLEKVDMLSEQLKDEEEQPEE